MLFHIAGFTHKGTGIYQSNEDSMLLNGNLLNDGELVLMHQEFVNCFVSDGVGGNAGGAFASNFILNKVKNFTDDELYLVEEMLVKINNELIITAAGEFAQCACTLSGMIVKNGIADFYHVGDSEIWLLRDDMLIKITKDEVVDEDDVSSPLLNYFGGGKSNLRLKTDWFKPEINAGDIFLLCSDGLFKALTPKLVKSILALQNGIEEKIAIIKENCLTRGAEDNVTVIVIEVERFE